MSKLTGIILSIIGLLLSIFGLVMELTHKQEGWYISAMTLLIAIFLALLIFNIKR